MTALGLIETKGLVAAIESADAMLKAADVRLLEKTQVGAGLVTITVAGEVAAVKASIEAAAAAVKRIDGATLVSEHVIPRPDAELESIILTKVKPATEVAEEIVQPSKPEAGAQAGTETPEKEETPSHDISQLKKMNVSKLRQLARSFDGFSIPREEIKFARKKELIEAIINAYRQEEE